METKTSLHPIHPTLQFEAKHALRFLGNLLKTRTTAVSGGRDLFVAGGLLDSDLTPSRETLEYLEGRSAAPAMKVNWFAADASTAPGDERFDGLDYFAG